MCVSRMLGCDASSRVDAICWRLRFPRFSASLFVASVLGALIPAGVAFLSSPNTPAPARFARWRGAATGHDRHAPKLPRRAKHGDSVRRSAQSGRFSEVIDRRPHISKMISGRSA